VLFLQLTLATAMIVGTVILHVAGVVVLVVHLRRHYPDHAAAFSIARSIKILTIVTLGLFLLHTIEIWAWAALYMVLGEFSELATALYFSTVTFTTLGYGDLTLAPDWQVLSGIEAANGIVLFGASTALLIAIFRRVVQDKLSDRPDDDG
jgi:voltage-gated potassium channel Kch